MKYVFFCLFIFYSHGLFSQRDTLAVLKLLDSAKTLGSSHYDKAIQFAKKAKEQALKIKYKRGEALTNNALASIYFNTGNIPQMEKYANSALEKLTLYGTLSEQADAINRMGLLYLSQAKYYRAEDYFLRAVDLFSLIKDTTGIVIALHNLGVINHYRGEYNKTAKYYDQALRLAETIKDEANANTVLRDLGLLYSAQNDFDKAKFYLRKALHNFEKANARLDAAHCWKGLGTAHFNAYQFDSSLVAHRQALKIFEELGAKDGIAQQLCNIADIYVQQENAEKAEEWYLKSIPLRKENNDQFGLILSYTGMANANYVKENPKIARLYFDSALTTAKKINASRQLATVYMFLSDFEAYNKNYKAAYEALTHYSEGKDSLLSAEKTSLAHELEAKYQNDKKQQEIQNKQNEILYLKKTNRIYVWLWALSGFVALLVVLLLINLVQRIRAKSKRAIEQEQAKKKEVEMELKYKKKELTQLALHISNQNEFLESFKNNLKEATDEQQKKSLERELESKLVLDKQREDFEMNINLIHEDFFRKLQEKFPSLTENEKKLCAMLRLNLSSKEIASVQNISPKSVEMNRYRLRQKFQLNSEENLNAFLSFI